MIQRMVESGLLPSRMPLVVWLDCRRQIGSDGRDLEHRVKPQHRSECGYRLMDATILWRGGPARGETLMGGRNQPRLRSLLGNWVNGGVSQGLPVPGEESAAYGQMVHDIFFFQRLETESLGNK